MCWYTDFLFVISIKYDFKYLLSTAISVVSRNANILKDQRKLSFLIIGIKVYH